MESMMLLVSTSIPYYLLVNSNGVNSTCQNPVAPSLVLGSGSMVASESMNRRVKRSYMFGIPRAGSRWILGYHSYSVHGGETGPTGSFLAQNVDNAGKDTRQIVIHHLLSCMLGAWGWDLLQCVMRTEVWSSFRCRFKALRWYLYTWCIHRILYKIKTSFTWTLIRQNFRMMTSAEMVKICPKMMLKNRGTTNNFPTSTCFLYSFCLSSMPLNSPMFFASPITIIGVFRHVGITETTGACRGCSWWPWL